MFTRRQIVNLLIPLVLEQILSGLMGIADTMMVTSVGDAAISAVSNVDAINTLVLNLLAALAAGGVIVCAQHLGRDQRAEANQAARQLLLTAVVISSGIAALCLIFRRPLLALIFGSVDADVMRQALQYFFITALSYPFLAAQQTAAAVFRASGRSAPPMAVAAVANCVNIAGNAVLIFVFHQGVVGAAVATTLSRVLSAALLLALLRSPKLTISIRDYRRIRPDWTVIGTVLRVGVPTGVENSMFQLGKLVVQSTVSTMGRPVMAAQAMIQTLDMVQCMPGQAIGLGLLTVAGQCMGAGRVDEAKKYTWRFCLISELTTAVMCGAVWAAAPFVTRVSGMSSESAALTLRIMAIISVMKCILWVIAFTLPNGMRAAGDVRYSATVSALSMWIFRTGGCLLLCRVFHVGLIGVWIAWFTDWGVRAIIYLCRWFSGKWADKQVLRAPQKD